jgi:nitroreductase
MICELPPIVEAVADRRSARSFLPDPVPRGMLDRILAVAACAPSGMNMQPWHVHAVQGAARDRLCRTVREAAERGELSPDYSYMPDPLEEPYRSRRRALGSALYELQGIDRQDRAARASAWLRNFDLFGAPVGLFLSTARSMAIGSWLDCGMFLQNVMLVAGGYGLDTCPQQSWCDFGGLVREHLGISEEEILICGLALGYANADAPENRLVSKRQDVTTFVTWVS